MNLENIEESIKEAVNQIGLTGEAHSKAKALSVYLQEMRKVVLSTEMNKSEAKTESAKEREALSSEIYKQHLMAMSEAIEEEGKLRAHFVKWNSEYEMLRSFLSLEKQKLRNDESLTHLGD